MKKLSISEQLWRLELLFSKFQTNSKEVLTFKEAAAYLDFKENYFYQLTSKGLVPSYKPNGRKLFFKRSELDLFAFQNRQMTQDEINSKAVEYVLKNQL